MRSTRLLSDLALRLQDPHAEPVRVLMVCMGNICRSPTAQAVLEKMEIRRFRLLGECLPGLGLAHAQGHCIIAKSGGFGQPDALSRIAGQILRRTG